MKLVKQFPTTRVKIQHRRNGKNNSNTVTFTDCTDEEVERYVQSVLKKIPMNCEYRPTSYTFSIGERKGFSFYLTVPIEIVIWEIANRYEVGYE